MEHWGGEPRAEAADELARSAVLWMLAADGGDHDLGGSLYSGRAGILLAIHAARARFDMPDTDTFLERGIERLVDDVEELEGSSLYFGLTGTAYALHRLGRPADARRALDHVRMRERDGRWGDMFELLAGNAGIGMGALHVGDEELALRAVAPYLTTWTRTAHGVNWAVRPTPPRSHHVAHGTLGIVLALTAVGRAVGREDLLELAVAGAEDVVARNEADDAGFLVPHSDPQHRPELIERFSLGWCNGPAGDAQVLRLLGDVTGEPRWRNLADRCWHTITSSGLPRRTRPGFWDNSGRCCGTAGVLALGCDRIASQGEAFEFADVLFDDLAARATVDAQGARWSNVEHRRPTPDLDSEPGWAMGNAGIVPELLRYADLRRGGSGAHAAVWPDRPPVLD